MGLLGKVFFKKYLYIYLIQLMEKLIIVFLIACTLSPSDTCLSEVDLDAELGVVPKKGYVQFQQVINPTTPNQVTDALIACVKTNLKNRDWCSSKHVKKGAPEIPVFKKRENSIETFSITNARITGLCNINRSKSASFNSTKTVLTATLVVEDVHLEANYTITIPGIENTSSEIHEGVIIEQMFFFADMELNVQDLKPQSVKSYSVRAGHDKQKKEGNIMPLLMAGFKKSSRQILEDTIAKDMRGVIKQDIHKCKPF